LARLIPASGKARFVRPANLSHFTLEELKGIVQPDDTGIYFAVVPGFHMGSLRILRHEESAGYDDLPINESASVLARQIIRGDALLIADNEWN